MIASFLTASSEASPDVAGAVGVFTESAVLAGVFVGAAASAVEMGAGRSAAARQ